MILQAGYDCYLTQAEDMPLSERRFENQVLINSPEDVAVWKEITSKQKEQMIAEASFIDVAAIELKHLTVWIRCSMISQRISTMPGLLQKKHCRRKTIFRHGRI